MTNLHQIYQKQVEAWKEKTTTGVFGGHFRDEEVDWDLVASSRHKDTIELIESVREMVLNLGDKFKPSPIADTEVLRKAEDFGFKDALIKTLFLLEEQLKLIKDEQ